MENESAQTMKLFISTFVNLFEDVCLLRKSAVQEKVSTWRKRETHFVDLSLIYLFDDF